MAINTCFSHKDHYRISLYQDSLKEKEAEWNTFRQTGMLFCMTGTCLFETSSMQTILQESQIAIISADEVFRIRDCEHGKYACVLLLVDSRIRQFFDANDSKIALHFFDEIKKTSIVDIISETSQLIFMAAQRLYRECVEKTFKHDFYKASLISIIMKEIIPLYRTANPVLKEHSCEVSQIEQSRVVKRAIHFINNNYDQDMNLNRIAQHLNINPSYLSRHFKKKLGVNITEFITTKRVFAAKNLLISTDGNVTEIALAVGFQNISYFNVVFKKHTGSSPTAFRKHNGTGIIRRSS